MSDLHRPDDVAVHNERSLKKLAWAIEASVGQFKLFLARCNYSSLRSRLVERLQELTGVEIRILELKTSEKTLYARIQAELDSEQPDALMVFGVESVGDLDELLSATNQVREEFRKNFHFPLVLWVNDEVMEKLLRLAPDFESWATTVAFLMASEDLANFLIQTAEQWFTDNLTLTLKACLELQAQLEAAQKDLLAYERVFTPELKADCESLLGFTKRVSNQIDVAIEHYQRSLVFWQQTNNLERQAKLLDEISFCYYLKAPPYRYKNHPVCQDAKHCVQEYLRVIEQLQRPDLITNSILRFGEVLGYLQDWEQLKVLAQQALQVHQAENKPIELARDYGFLAEVALAQERWNDASELARKALEVLLIPSSSQSPDKSEVVYELINKSVVRNDPRLYLFILAKSQQHLGQLSAAICNLEAAREVGRLRYDPQLYLDILSHLQRLYFEQKDYLKAFEIKQERQSIEQQYGLRAFIGAGRIQPQRQARLALKQVVETLHQTCTQETVAPEITASGRQLDVERLIRRIGRNDSKLIVIYGESGVGKSSLMYGGLVPALKQKSMGTSDVLPVAMRVYTSWVEQLGKLLAGVLEEKEIDLTAPLDSEAAILEELQHSESRNLRTVLIFDQFEEFFFVYPAPAQRRRFFEFVGACLNILPVKVILSLRKDYLHYLLECNRLPSMKIISNDILTKNVLYELGNFSPADAKAVIQCLTEVSNFHLEPTLIEQLVQDLAGNLGEVRPIEIQIVGAQLQTDNITALAEYRERGQKEELVKRYLAEVVEDCGAENKQAAELVLYLLTDEKGTRPLKTRAEVERDLRALAAGFTAEASRLDLVLEIFVDSGLVVLLPELPADRYQLVHDYLAAFIRQQQEPKLNELIAALEKERKLRSLTEEELRQTLRQLEKSLEHEKQVRRQAEIAEIEALSLSSQALFLSHDQLGALIAAVKAGKQLKVTDTPLDVQRRTLARLRQAVYGIRELNRLQGHSEWVNSISFSPDGQCLASGSGDCTVKLWNLDGRELQTLSGHSDWVNSVSFSSDGQFLASGSGDCTVKLWSLDGQEVQTFSGHSRGVRSISFSPDNQMLASGSDDGTIKLWSLDGQEVQTFSGHSRGVRSISFSPDNQMLASGSDDGTIKLWSLNRQEVQTFSGHSAEVNCISFSPDGLVLASGSNDDTVKLWSLDGQQLQTFLGHSDRIVSIAFSPDSQILASGSGDGTVKLWSLDGRALKTFSGHSEWVNSISFRPDGRVLASGSGDRTIKLWSLDSQELKIFSGYSNRITSISFNPNGQMLAAGASNDTIKLWRLDGREIKTFSGNSSGIGSISFSPDGQVLASGSYNGTVKLWNFDGQQLKIFSGHSRRVRSISFSPDGQILASCCDHSIKIWSLDGRELQTFSSYIGNRSISFSPDGRVLASGSRDGAVRLWYLDGQELQTLSASGDRVSSVIFSPDGRILASGNHDGTITLWNLDARESHTLIAHATGVHSISFSPDGQILASGSGDRTVKLWSKDGRELQTFSGHSAGVTSVSFSPDGQILASGSCDGTVILRNLDLLELNLGDLLIRGCNWLRDYLATNRYVEESDKYLCDGLEKKSNEGQ